MSETERPISDEVTLETVDQIEVDRDEQSARLLRFLDAVHAEDVFDTKEHKQDFIRNLSYEDLTRLILSANGILRDIPRQEREMYGEVMLKPAETSGWSFGLTTEHDTPRSADKPGLLRHAYEKARTREDPKDVGLIVAAAINAIHIFEDGNGRTSRLIYDLLNYNYEGSEKDKNFLQAALSENGRWTTPNINPDSLLYLLEQQVLREEGYYNYQGSISWLRSLYPKQRQDILSKREDITDEQKQLLTQLFSKEGDSKIVFLAVARCLKRSNRLSEFTQPSRAVNENTGLPEYHHIMESIIAEKATGAEIEEYIESYWSAKTEMVGKMINALADNQTIPIYHGDWGEQLREVPARDLLREQISTKLEHFKSSSLYADLRENWPETPEETP